MTPPTAARLLDEAEVILLDQGKTFMFENDRFGPGADYAQTYRALGGSALGAGEVRQVVEQLFASLDAAYRDARFHADFSTVEEHAEALSLGLSEEEARRFAQLIGRHELGVVSERHRAALRALAITHRLGIVSNFWGPGSVAEQNLQSAGVLSLFEHRIWSSEHGHVKPSPALFERALERFAVPAERVLFVGDDPLRDVHPAKRLGMRAVWIASEPRVFPEGGPTPDLTVHHLEELLS